MTSVEKINLRDAFASFSEHWQPRLAGRVNDCAVKLAKLQGEFIWHHHDREDELFLVFKGALRMQFRDREVTIREGEFLIVPRGVEHRPVADHECHILLFEPADTLNTGNVVNERTLRNLQRIGGSSPAKGPG